MGDLVDEGSVVTNQHHSLGTLDKKLLKPLYGLYVKVVGGFVKQ